MVGDVARWQVLPLLPEVRWKATGGFGAREGFDLT